MKSEVILSAMSEAIKLAQTARGNVAPNPMVGAVVLDSQYQIIGRGFHPRAGEPHAEVFAIKEALTKKSNLSGCTLVVTLEPCNHFGKTPPCVDLILDSKIKNVVVGSIDPHGPMQGKSVLKLKNNGVNVEVGTLMGACDQLIRGFKSVLTNHRPFISLKSAASLDGKIATSIGESHWITEEPARQLGHQERSQHDAILVGVGTILADDPQLNIRLNNEIVSHEITKIILDSQLRTPVEAKVLKSPGKTLIYCSPYALLEKKALLEKAGATVVQVDQSVKGGLSLPAVLKDAAKRGVQELLVEGGAKILGAFVREEIFDRLIYFISPRILGSEGRDAFDGLGFERLDESLRLENVSTRLIGRDIVIEGTKPCSPV